MNETIIFKCVFGSHLYGLNTADSDMDYKAIVLPSQKDIWMQRGLFSKNTSSNPGSTKNTSDDTDMEVMSLHKFIKLGCNNEMIAIDMLHVPYDSPLVLESHPVWRDLQSKRHLFYSKDMAGFLGYVKKQAAKYSIKGSRLAAMSDALDVLYARDAEIPLNVHLYNMPVNDYARVVTKEGANGQEMQFYELCGKMYQGTSSVENVRNAIQKMYDSYGHRAKLAERNEGIDWKAVSHALRAAYQLHEIYTEGDITFPLRKREWLLRVKEGELHYKNEVAPVLEELVDEVQRLADKSPFPEKVDKDFWEEWLMEIYSYFLTK